jgi:hypothetical protein
MQVALAGSQHYRSLQQQQSRPALEEHLTSEDGDEDSPSTGKGQHQACCRADRLERKGDKSVNPFAVGDSRHSGQHLKAVTRDLDGARRGFGFA